MLTVTGLTTPIDPTEIYYTDTNSILTGLVTRSLTQYVYDEESGQMILVPTSPPTWARPTRTSPSGRSRSATA